MDSYTTLIHTHSHTFTPHTQTQTHTDSYTDTHKQTQTDTYTHHSYTHRHTQTHTDTHKHTNGHTQTHTYTIHTHTILHTLFVSMSRFVFVTFLPRNSILTFINPISLKHWHSEIPFQSNFVMQESSQLNHKTLIPFVSGI